MKLSRSHFLPLSSESNPQKTERKVVPSSCSPLSKKVRDTVSHIQPERQVVPSPAPARGKGAMATSLTDDNFDWCSFYALFWNVRSPISHPQTRTFATPNSRNKSANYFLVGKMSTPTLTLSPPHPPNRLQDRGLKLKLRMVETVLFRDGRLSSWWFTDKVRPRRARNLPVFFFFSFSHFLFSHLWFLLFGFFSFSHHPHPTLSRTASSARRPRRARRWRRCGSGSCTWGSRCTTRRTRGSTRASSGAAAARLRGCSAATDSTRSSR